MRSLKSFNFWRIVGAASIVVFIGVLIGLLWAGVTFTLNH